MWETLGGTRGGVFLLFVPPLLFDSLFDSFRFDPRGALECLERVATRQAVRSRIHCEVDPVHCEVDPGGEESNV
jgi:hypothetical protein